MIKHIVCFKLKNPTEELCNKTKEILLSMKGNVPMLIHVNVGIDFLHSERSYDIILETYFETKEDLDNYQNDPYHCNVVKKHMHAVRESSVAIDYEIDVKGFEFEVRDHEFGVDFWHSKKELFEHFFGDFYEFILSHDGQADLESHNIHCLEDFYNYADWNADGKDSCYAMGFSFHKYYLTPVEGDTLENQPDSTFIGYCYKNNLYKDFLNFLVTFFAWWRNDEGCTTFDPYNHADDFFNSSWAALVDTCKLFYLSAQTVYHWQSFRVKYALDNIPGVLLQYPIDEDDELIVAGYEFLGYDKEDGKYIANFKRKDTYNYWGIEEKKIKKVYVKDYKKADPA